MHWCNIGRGMLDSPNDTRLAAWCDEFARSAGPSIASLAATWTGGGGNVRIRANALQFVWGHGRSHLIGARIVAPRSAAQETAIEFLLGRLRLGAIEGAEIEEMRDNLAAFGGQSDRRGETWRLNLDDSRAGLLLGALLSLCREVSE